MKNRVKIHWLILSYILLIPLLLLVSNVLTVINTFSFVFFDLYVAKINPATFGVVVTVRCSGVSVTSMAFPSYMSDALDASQLSSLSFGLSNSAFQSCESSVTKMLCGELSSSLSAGWRSIHFIRWNFNTWGCPPGRFFADNAGGRGHLSDNLNATAPPCCKFEQDALTTYSVSEMYLTLVTCLFWARDSWCVAHRFHLPCHISKTS